MSDQDNLFKEENKEQTKAPETDNTLQDLLGGIVNERGEQKYKTVADALVGLRNAQEFIPTLQKEKKELEEKYSAAQAEADRIAALEESILQLSGKEKQEQEGTPQASVASPESVTKLVESYLSQRDSQATKAQNLQAVTAKVKEVYGDKAKEAIYTKAQELGMTTEALEQLAASNPKACLKILDISENGAHKQSNSFSPSSSINSSGLKPTTQPLFKRPEKSIMFGASSQDILDAAQAAKKMSEALHEQGMSAYDLANPKVYRKMFG